MYHNSSMSSISGIQGKILEVTVVGCNKLKDTEWISRQDPYVCVEYASTKFRTRTCTDGGKNPTFQEKFVFTLIEGLRELSIVVWNSNTLTFDDFIGSGKVQLQKVLSQGYDDSPWTLQTKTGRYAGEVRLILHFAGANLDKPPKTHAPSAPPFLAPQVPVLGLLYTTTTNGSLPTTTIYISLPTTTRSLPTTTRSLPANIISLSFIPTTRIISLSVSISSSAFCLSSSAFCLSSSAVCLSSSALPPTFSIPSGISTFFTGPSLLSSRSISRNVSSAPTLR